MGKEYKTVDELLLLIRNSLRVILRHQLPME